MRLSVKGYAILMRGERELAVKHILPPLPPLSFLLLVSKSSYYIQLNMSVDYEYQYYLFMSYLRSF